MPVEEQTLTDSALRESLGVPPEAGAAEVKSALRTWVRNNHPDRGGETSNEKFGAVTSSAQAYAERLQAQEQPSTIPQTEFVPPTSQPQQTQTQGGNPKNYTGPRPRYRTNIDFDAGTHRNHLLNDGSQVFNSLLSAMKTNDARTQRRAQGAKTQQNSAVDSFLNAANRGDYRTAARYISPEILEMSAVLLGHNSFSRSPETQLLATAFAAAALAETPDASFAPKANIVANKALSDVATMLHTGHAPTQFKSEFALAR